MPSAIPLLTEIFSRENWGKAIALHDLGASFSILAIPVLIAFTLRFFHWRTFFVLLSGACMMGMICFWVFAPNPRPQEEKRPRYASVLCRKDFWIMAILWIVASMASNGLYGVTPLFLVKERGMGVETANAIFGFTRAGGLFVTVLLGFLLDRYGVRKILFLVMLTTGLSTVGLAVAQSYPLLVSMLILQGTLSVAFFPVGLVTVSKLTNVNERGMFAGMTIASGTMVGLGLTPVALGAIADVWNFQVGILGLGALTAASCMLLRGLGDI
jgi:NNP family nitrate/nitrite transporter-like MFS transporter